MFAIFETPSGPTTDSSDATERIIARRLRIKKRRRKNFKEKYGYDPEEEIKEEIVLRSTTQHEISYQYLNAKEIESDTFVTNVRTAVQTRTLAYFMHKEDNNRDRSDKLENEYRSAQEKFDELQNRWELYPTLNLAHEYHDFLVLQRGTCDAIMEEKHKIANELQAEMKKSDVMLAEVLFHQKAEIDILLERIDDIYGDSRKSYEKELHEIEFIYKAERRELMERHVLKWDDLMFQRRLKEEHYLKYRDEGKLLHEKEVVFLRKQNMTEIGEIKDILEADLAMLQLQLSKMKAVYQVNQEKIEYNFQVLKKRDEENTRTRNLQKRRLTRIQDVLIRLRNWKMRMEKRYASENSKLVQGHIRVRQLIQDLATTSKQFRDYDEKTYDAVWVQNEDECKKLMTDIMNTDKMLHEQYMNMTYKPPNISFMDSIGPLGPPPFKKAEELVQAAFDAVPAEQMVHQAISNAQDTLKMQREGTLADYLLKGIDPRKNAHFPRFTYKTLRELLALACREAKFLVASRMEYTLLSLTETQQALIRADALLKALNIDQEDDLHMMGKFFEDFVHIAEQEMTRYPSGYTETIPEEPSSEEDLSPLSSYYVDADFDPFDPSNYDPHGYLTRQPSPSTISTDEDSIMSDEEVMEIVKRTGKRLTERYQNLPINLQDRCGGEVHPNDVVRVIRKYLEEYKCLKDGKDRNKVCYVAQYRNRDQSRDADYWEAYLETSATIERRFDVVLEAMKKNLENIQIRTRLSKTCERLRRENNEIRHLLIQYFSKEDETNLCVPISRWLMRDAATPTDVEAEIFPRHPASVAAIKYEEDGEMKGLSKEKLKQRRNAKTTVTVQEIKINFGNIRR